MKHYELVEFLSNLYVKAPFTNVKPARTNVKALPYWWISGDGSGSTAHAVSCENI